MCRFHVVYLEASFWASVPTLATMASGFIGIYPMITSMKSTHEGFPFKQCGEVMYAKYSVGAVNVGG